MIDALRIWLQSEADEARRRARDAQSRQDSLSFQEFMHYAWTFDRVLARVRAVCATCGGDGTIVVKAETERLSAPCPDCTTEQRHGT